MQKFRNPNSGDFKIFSVANRLISVGIVNEFKANTFYGFGNNPVPATGVPSDNKNGLNLVPLKKVSHGQRLFEDLLQNFDYENRPESDLINELIKIGRDETV